MDKRRSVHHKRGSIDGRRFGPESPSSLHHQSHHNPRVHGNPHHEHAHHEHRPDHDESRHHGMMYSHHMYIDRRRSDEDDLLALRAHRHAHQHESEVDLEKPPVGVDADYNPFAHRLVEKPSSDMRSLANLVKSSLGCGILAMPSAFANGGWFLSTISTFIIALLCTHCVHIFVKTSRGVCKKQRVPLLGYAATCKGTFETGPKSLKHLAKPAFVIAEICLIATYLGVCCIFTVLIANSIKQPFDRYVTSTNISLKYYCLIIILPLCLMVQIKHLKYLAIFSIIANILLILTFLICLYYIFGDKITISDKQAFGGWSRYPVYLSTVIFAMEGIGVVMPIENAMKHPEHFLGIPSILCIAMSLITFLYAVLGLFGYLRFGNDVRGSIVLNLPIDDWPAVYAKFFIALSIFLTYPIHFFVVIDTLNRVIAPHIKKEHEFRAQIIIRIVIVLFCGAIGIAIPLLEQIISIVGALFYSILGLIIPGILDTVFKWKRLGRNNWVLWKNGALIFFGFFCLFSGCLTTILDIVHIFQHGKEDIE